MRAVASRIAAGLLLGSVLTAQNVRGVRPEQVLVPDWVAAGPMLGHVGPDRVHVWLRVRKGVEFVARASLESADGLRPVHPRIEKLGDGVRLLVFEGLPADTPMVVQVCQGKFFNRGVGIAVRTAPAPAPVGRVRIAFGSGCQDVLHPKLPVLLAAARERPDLFVFAGDSTYYVREYRVPSQRFDKQGKRKKPELRIDTASGDGDWQKAGRMLDRQLVTRTNPWLQPLLRSVPCYAVWDDHDFGHRDADRHFDGRKKSLRVFQQVWANPAYGTAATKGCFSSFRRGPVEVFLLDGRYHRDVRRQQRDDDEGRIWGPEQLRWLCQGLQASSAPVKLIVQGTPFLPRGREPVGHAALAPGEYRQLLAFLDEHAIGGVVFLTGDRQHSELLKQRRGQRWLVELSSSPLAGGQAIGASQEPRRSGTEWQVRGDSYGLVTVDIPEPGAGSITLEVRDASNRVPMVGGRHCRTRQQLADLR